MRWLMWFVVGFAAACGAGAYLLRGMGLLLLGAACLLLLVPAALMRKKWRFSVVAAVILLGAVFGCGVFWGYDQLYVETVRMVDGQTVDIVVTASDFSWETDYGCAVDGYVALEGKRYKVRAYLDEVRQIAPGDEIRMPARLRFTDEGGESEPTYHRTNGILLLVYQEDEALTVTDSGDAGFSPGVLRRHLKDIINTCFPEDAAGFARGLLLGDKTGLDYRQKLSFRLTGLSHIVAVSGLHISMLYTLVFRTAGKRRHLTALIGIPLVFLLAAVAGFTPSVTRAAMMQVIMMLALVLRREYDPPTALAFSVLVMLIVNPLVIASAGFQLSVGSVAGIHLFYEKLNKALRARLGVQGKKLRRLASSLALSLSATVMTVPLVAYYFGTVSLISLLSNFLVLPVVSVLFYGVMLTCLAGALVPVLGSWIGWLVAWVIRFVLGLTELLADFPLAAVYTESVYVVIWLALCYGLVAAALIRKIRSALPAVCCGAVGLCLALTASWAEPLMDEYRVMILDVGQGQCVLLQSRGSTFMVDCGGDYNDDAGDKAAETLLSMGITRIDGLILTHYDRDHAGGVEYLAERIAIERLYLPRTEDTDGLLDTVLVSAADAERIMLDTDVEILLDGCSIRIFAPEKENSGNESCAAVLFQSEKYDTLITGDMGAVRERELLERADLPDLEVLIVGHHGSKTSTSAELVYRTAPDVAVISVGGDNAYGHPAPEILRRLALYGCEIYRTDLMGDIVFRG